MKISYNWIKDYCKCEADVEEVAEKITLAGMEVESITPFGDDFVLELEITPNRADCLSFLGLAREIAVVFGEELKIPETEYETIGQHSSDWVDVIIEDPDLCPIYTARIIKDCEVKESPVWLKNYLESIGLRSVNNVVDISNFVLMECGQPLHTFDYDKLQSKKIIVRRAFDEEVMVAIDGSEYEMNEDMLVIATEKKSVAIAGVMGGLESEVDENTKCVLLESAYFNPPSIRRTSRKLGLFSDSSYRFERGVNPFGVDWGSRRACQLIQELANGKVAKGVVEVNLFDQKPEKIKLRVDRIKKILGIEIDKEEAKDILSKLEFKLDDEDDESITVTPPTFRMNDVKREIDLIEEVARIHGFDKIPAETNMPIVITQRKDLELFEERVKKSLQASNYLEVYTSSFTNKDLSAQFNFWSEKDYINITNPIKKDEAALRKSIIPGLLEIKRTNYAKGNTDIKIFEVSRVYLKETETESDEKNVLAILHDGDFSELKGTIELLLEDIGVTEYIFKPSNLQFIDPTFCSGLKIGTNSIGYLGKLDDKVKKQFQLKTTPYIAEVDLDFLTKIGSLQKTYSDLPRFPAIERDISMTFNEETTWNEIINAIDELNIELLEEVKYFDSYRGKQIPKDKKSIAFSLIFRAKDRTLKSEEADSEYQRTIERLESSLNGELRK